MLRMENVTKSYHHRGHLVKALDGATLHIPGGDFVSVVGPSGSGKSTLLLMLGGMLSPSEGRVLLEASSVYDLSQYERAKMRREKVGFVFQTFNLVPYLSALENVQVPLFLAKIEEKAQKDRATALLERVGLGDRLDHKPGELSVGQQQRVALARMLANDPAIILADEPTGNLDPETSQQIIGFLEEFNAEGKTIVMVTHDPRAAKRAKRTLRLQNGTITCQGVGEAGCWSTDSAVA
jgi:putative ABC transport system ATP-binding protein